MELKFSFLHLLFLIASAQLATSQLSASVRDLVKGLVIRPNVGCELYRETGPHQWELLTESVTNDRGGCPNLITQEEFSLGNYQIVMKTKSYWESRNLTSFYPHIEVQFEHAVLGSTYSFPFSISPYGYSIYKGSTSK